ncbi:MAG: PaaI family thioesterase [Pusillimonas sp.]
MNQMAAIGTHLTGLEQLKTMAEHDIRCGFADTLDIRMTEAHDGRVVFECTPDVHLYNPNSVVHGGFIATMMDFACGYVALSKVAPGFTIATVEIKISYHKAVTKDTGAIQAIGSIVSAGRRMIFTEAKLVDSANRLLASATSSVMVLPITPA